MNIIDPCAKMEQVLSRSLFITKTDKKPKEKRQPAIQQQQWKSHKNGEQLPGYLGHSQTKPVNNKYKPVFTFFAKYYVAKFI